MLSPNRLWVVQDWEQAGFPREAFIWPGSSVLSQLLVSSHPGNSFRSRIEGSGPCQSSYHYYQV